MTTLRTGSPARRPGLAVWALTGALALVAAWPIATMIVGDPFAFGTSHGVLSGNADRGVRLSLVPADDDPTERPVFSIPEFALIDQDGKPFGSKELEGRLWVASFFFTSCPTLCPQLTKQLVALQARLEAEDSPARIVTFTVDPETDTPPVLAAHARKVGANPSRWTFLTGQPGDLERTIVQGFKQPMGTPDAASETASAMAIAHGVRFVLVDRDLGVRGLYDANVAGIDALIADARAL